LGALKLLNGLDGSANEFLVGALTADEAPYFEQLQAESFDAPQEPMERRLIGHVARQDCLDWCDTHGERSSLKL